MHTKTHAFEGHLRNCFIFDTWQELKIIYPLLKSLEIININLLHYWLRK